MNKAKITYQQSWSLSAFLTMLMLVLGSPSSFAQEVSSLPDQRAAVTRVQSTIQGQSDSRKSTSLEKEDESLDFSDTGRSGQQTAGETRRGQCSSRDFPLTALSPSSNYGKTIASHPRLWFYVPYSDEDISKIEFVIQDADHNDISRQVLQSKTIPGYLSAELPKSESGLENGKLYRWYFKVYCQQTENTSPLFVQGWIEKVAISKDLSTQVQVFYSQANMLQNQFGPQFKLKSSVVISDANLAEFSLLKQGQLPHMLYAQNELWYDAINSLFISYMANPNDDSISEDWLKLTEAKGANLELPELDSNNLFGK